MSVLRVVKSCCWRRFHDSLTLHELLLAEVSAGGGVMSPQAVHITGGSQSYQETKRLFLEQVSKYAACASDIEDGHAACKDLDGDFTKAPHRGTILRWLEFDCDTHQRFDAP